MSYLPLSLVSAGGNVEDVVPVSALTTSFGDTYSFDFTTRQFVQTGVAQDDPIVILEQQDSLEQYLAKLLLTPRYEYLAYTHAFGSSVQSAVAAAVENGWTNIAIYAEQAVKETLRIDSRVGAVESVVVVLDDPDTPTEVDVTAVVRDTFGSTITVNATIPV
jgi:hypothetical protein